MRGPGNFAIQVAIAQTSSAMMQRKLARIIGDDPAGVDDHALHRGALPVLAPPGNVVARRIDLGDVGLPPAIGATIPRNRLAFRRILPLASDAAIPATSVVAATCFMKSRREVIRSYVAQPPSAVITVFFFRITAEGGCATSPALAAGRCTAVA